MSLELPKKLIPQCLSLLDLSGSSLEKPHSEGLSVFDLILISLSKNNSILRVFVKNKQLPQAA